MLVFKALCGSIVKQLLWFQKILRAKVGWIRSPLPGHALFPLMRNADGHEQAGVDRYVVDMVFQQYIIIALIGQLHGGAAFGQGADHSRQHRQLGVCDLPRFGHLWFGGLRDRDLYDSVTLIFKILFRHRDHVLFGV